MSPGSGEVQITRRGATVAVRRRRRRRHGLRTRFGLRLHRCCFSHRHRWRWSSRQLLLLLLRRRRRWRLDCLRLWRWRWRRWWRQRNHVGHARRPRIGRGDGRGGEGLRHGLPLGGGFEVGELVVVAGGGARVALGAVAAGVGPFAGVCALVLRAMVRALKRRRAVAAVEGASVRVHEEVPGEVAAGRKALATRRAAQRFHRHCRRRRRSRIERRRRRHRGGRRLRRCQQGVRNEGGGADGHEALGEQRQGVAGRQNFGGDGFCRRVRLRRVRRVVRDGSEEAGSARRHSFDLAAGRSGDCGPGAAASLRGGRETNA